MGFEETGVTAGVLASQNASNITQTRIVQAIIPVVYEANVPYLVTQMRYSMTDMAAGNDTYGTNLTIYLLGVFV